MYGNMATVRTDESNLRAMANEMRSRALALTAQAEAMAWNSGAAQAFRIQITETADDLGRSAATLDAAADALATHARAVDAVKQAISEAQEWVEERLNDARTVVSNVTKSVFDVAEHAVTGFMTRLGSIIDGATTRVQVSVYRLFGNDVPTETVQRAQTITQAVPTSPSHGARDWLDLKDTFAGNGW